MARAGRVLAVVSLASVLSVGCSKEPAPEKAPPTGTPVPAAKSPGGGAAAAPAPAAARGKLRVNATDGSFVHEVLIRDAAGAVVAKGSSGFFIDVPAGSYQASAQGQSFPVTVVAGKDAIVNVADQAGLGRLRMNASDGSNIHEVVVTDAAGKVVAKGASGFYIDVRPGKYKATVQGKSFDVTITKGQDTVVKVGP